VHVFSHDSLTIGEYQIFPVIQPITMKLMAELLVMKDEKVFNKKIY